MTPQKETAREPRTTKEQGYIESIHQRLMDIRDSIPCRRGHITADREYTRVYLRAYKQSRLSEFYRAAEKYRHFLQDGKRTRVADQGEK